MKLVGPLPALRPRAFGRRAVASAEGGPLAARSPGLRLALALEIERHGSADEIFQGCVIDLVAALYAASPTVLDPRSFSSIG
jgi:hypothetical protein